MSYSGGKDSHFLYWFIKEYLHDNKIEIVSANTYMEHPQILKRMRENADRILVPKIKPFEIKEKYGIPCFSKAQDKTIESYQKGNRAEWIMKQLKETYYTGRDGVERKSSFRLNSTARTLLLENKLHKISPKCCLFLKKSLLNSMKENRERNLY